MNWRIWLYGSASVVGLYWLLREPGFVNACIVASAVLLTASTTEYVTAVETGAKEPKLSFWIVAVLALWISFVVYWRHNPDASFSANLSGNLAAPFALIMCGAVVRNYRRAKLKHDWLDYTCYGLVVVTFIWWWATGYDVATYVICQVVMTIGYARLIIHLAWQASENTEPMASWVIVLLGNLLAVPKAVVSHDGFALVFLARTIGLPAVVLGLMIRLEINKFGRSLIAYFDAEDEWEDIE